MTAVLAVVAFGLLWSTFLSSPLPKPAPFDGSWPKNHVPAEMKLVKLPTGVTHRSSAFAYRGGSFFDKRDFSMTALLVKHPKGDLLIDTGFGKNIAKHLALMPKPFQWATSYTRYKSAAEQLDSMGYDRKNLRAILLTHAHWDHVSGVEEFPTTPVWVTHEEKAFITSESSLSVVLRSFQSVNYEEYSFGSGPFLNFEKSYDVYGDGSVVVVPAPGHTPGSVIVFLTTPDERHYAMLGDLVWQQEGITQREERPWVQRTLGDNNPERVRDSILRVSSLIQKFDSLTIIPAHDSRGFERIGPNYGQ